MREAGLRTWLDAVGNVHGRVDGRARDAPALILGSHYDTVMDAGKYDGALGIIVGHRLCEGQHPAGDFTQSPHTTS